MIPEEEQEVRSGKELLSTEPLLLLMLLLLTTFMLPIQP